MKRALLSFLAFAAIVTSAFVQSDTNSARRISIAEVGTVRLEVEQPTHENEVRIRVRDYAARNWQKKTVSCEIYYVGEDGKEGKIQTVTLKQVLPTSDDYSGSSSDRNEFEHGNIVRVVYKSDGLRLPISTWYAFYYH